ncbi:MAG TPA: alkaline phosphatase family protein, partial [Thermoplasmata archaeon]|nr:alkaline phosphatase family protein [Thermoplasmata archaeon]
MPHPARISAVVLLLAVAGCGSSSPSPSPSSATASVVVPSLPPVSPAPAGSSAPAGSAAPAGPPHVMVIVMENREESDVVGRSDAPYTTSLANGYGLATHWYGVSHPSRPNYLAMVSGSTQGVSDDGTSYSFAGPTLVDQLAQRGIGWKAYMQDMPSVCFGGGSSGGYAKKHDPFMYFRSITGNPAQCGN